MPQPVLVEVVSDAAHAPDVAAIAAATFPLACPPHSRPEDIAGHIRDNLRPEVFAHHIESTESDVLVARVGIGGRIVGYALAVHTAPDHPDVAAVVTQRPVTEISKMYVSPEHHAAGQQTPPSHALMRTALEIARGRGSMLAWLGVNQENARAQRFYTKMGFVRAGVKTFDLHGSVEYDFIFVRQL